MHTMTISSTNAVKYTMPIFLIFGVCVYSMLDACVKRVLELG